MKKIVVIPDSFKGTLSSMEVCHLVETQISRHFPACQVVSIPVADGGEGTVEALLTAVGGTKVFETAKNPHFQDMTAHFGLLADGKIAVVETAVASGLPLVEDCKDPMTTTTYGTGQLILAAAHHGATKIVVGLGGSATNDGGCGAAAAVGVVFYDNQGQSFVPTGGTLCRIDKIDFSHIDACLQQVEIVAMCDIDNPMYGTNGASYIFGPQKGADPDTVEILDQGIQHLNQKLIEALGKDVSQIPGTGAAGAFGAGILAFFGGTLQMGIQTVLDTVQFDQVIQNADYIFTGEGKLDSQSLRGKVVLGIASRAIKQNKPVLAIVGGVSDQEVEQAYEMGVTAVFPINRLPQDLSISKHYSGENVSHTVDNILRLLKTTKKEEN